MALIPLLGLALALAVGAGLLFALGTPLFGGLLLLLLLVGFVVWLVLLATSRRTASGAVREVGGDRPELLGPGGPDDPDR